MKIKWTKTKEGNMTGRFEEYKIEIYRQNHGGWAYDLVFENKGRKLILAREGRSYFYIKTTHAAKWYSLKKLNFFYAQQHNQTKELQK